LLDVFEAIQDLGERSQSKRKGVTKEPPDLLTTVGCCVSTYEFMSHNDNLTQIKRACAEDYTPGTAIPHKRLQIVLADKR
jgi:hypothetical protein